MFENLSKSLIFSIVSSTMKFSTFLARKFKYIHLIQFSSLKLLKKWDFLKDFRTLCCKEKKVLEILVFLILTWFLVCFYWVLGNSALRQEFRTCLSLEATVEFLCLKSRGERVKVVNYSWSGSGFSGGKK